VRSEEPSYWSIRRVLALAGCVPVPVAVDREGLNVAAGIKADYDTEYRYEGMPIASEWSYRDEEKWILPPKRLCLSLKLSEGFHVLLDVASARWE
jgi:hypothetical protein